MRENVQVAKTCCEVHGSETVSVLHNNGGLGGGEELAACDVAAGYGENERRVAFAVAEVGVGFVLEKRLDNL